MVITDSERDNLYNSLSWYLVHNIYPVKSNNKINRDLSGYNYDFMKIYSYNWPLPGCYYIKSECTKEANTLQEKSGW